MQMSKIINIPKEYKDLDKSLLVNNIELELPIYVRRSISKYRFIVKDNTIYLQRLCNVCGNFFNVKKVEDRQYISIDKYFREIGEKSGFHNTCITCEGKTPVKSVSNDNLAQLNIKISNDLKKYYQILSINNSSTLKDEVTAALIFYKNHLKDKKTCT